jgi:amino acid adenylation domain-containing protein
VSVALGPELSDGLIGLARLEAVTLSIVVQAMWGVLLAKHGGRRDVVYGSVVSTRTAEIEDCEGILGPCIAMLPLRIAFDAGESVRSLLKRLQHAASDWLANIHCALADIQARGGFGRTLFDHYVVVENYASDPATSGAVQRFADGLSITDVRSFLTNNYDFYVSVHPGREIEIELNFNPDIFARLDVDAIARRFRQLLEAAVADPGAEIDRLSLASTAERATILESWSAGAASTRLATSVAAARRDLLAAGGAARQALSIAGRSVSHLELQDAAERAAGAQRDRFGIRPGDPVAVTASPTEGTIQAMLACLLLGAPFVPLDPAAPEERNALILADCGARLLITTDPRAIMAPIPGLSTATIEDLAKRDAVPLDAVEPDAPAYIIYTSGTTGRPKGVKVGQKALLNYVGWLARDIGIGPEDRSMLVTSAAFDLGYTTLFGSLLLGGCLTLVDDEVRKDPQRVVERVIADRITWLKATPSYLAMLLAGGSDGLSKPCDLKLLLLGGERQRFADLRALRRILPTVSIMNHYGPTEATIGCIAGTLDDLVDAAGDPPQRLGRPVAGAQILLCDHAQQLVPAGTPGEILVLGDGLAQGYVGAAAADEGRFVMLPWLGGARAYCTGDWGEWLPDGRLAFHGRRDGQIKVRGYRVELSGIEASVAGLPEIAACAVLADPALDGDFELVCYFVPVAGAVLSPSMLRTKLAMMLPDPMIPARYVPLSRLPMTVNGKVDHRVLRAHAAPSAAAKGDDASAPGSDTEQALRRIWSEVLFHENIGLDDDFFALGGHSIKAVVLIARIRKQLQKRLVIRDLYDHPTVRRLAARIDGAGQPAAGALLKLRPAPASAPAALFLPPVLGSSTVYRELIDQLRVEIACYGAQCPGFDRDEPMAESIETLAETFAEQASGLGGAGPLRLVGWSMGAHVALETASRLERRGRVVRLVLIDAVPRSQGRTADSLEPVFGSLDELARHPYWAGVCRILFASLAGEDRARIERLSVRNRAMIERFDFGGGLGADLYCVEALDNPAPARMAGFGNVTSGRCIVQRVAGDHYSMFQPPNLGRLVEILEQALAAP